MQAANVGDSSAALGRVSVSDKSAHGAKYLTPEHKVRHKEERDRLNEAGAELPPEATRLYGLALSRALGDKFLKDQNVGLIAHPFVSEPIDVNGTTDNAVGASAQKKSGWLPTRHCAENGYRSAAQAKRRRHLIHRCLSRHLTIPPSVIIHSNVLLTKFIFSTHTAHT
jgi:hypothetical protein